VIQHLKLNNQPILEEDFKNPGEDSASSIMEEFHGFTEDS
jgi:hypothetical protein